MKQIKIITFIFIMLTFWYSSYSENTFDAKGKTNTIKVAYKKALKQSKSYFKVGNLEINQRDFDKFMKRNKDLKAKYVLGQPVTQYGHIIKPIIKAEFIIKSLREKEIDNKIRKYAKEGYIIEENKKWAVAHKLIFKREGSNTTLFNRTFPNMIRNYLDVKALLKGFEGKDYDLKDNYIEKKIEHYVINNNIIKGIKQQKVFFNFQEPVSRNNRDLFISLDSYINEEKQAYQKALNGGVTEFMDYYEKYFGFYEHQRESLIIYQAYKKKWFDRLDRLLFSKTKFDDEIIEKERERIYERNYKMAIKNLEDHHFGDYQLGLNSPLYYAEYLVGFLKLYHEIDDNRYDPKNYSKDLAFREIKFISNFYWSSSRRCNTKCCINFLEKLEGRIELFEQGYSNISEYEYAKIQEIKKAIKPQIAKLWQEYYDEKRSEEEHYAKLCAECQIDFEQIKLPSDESRGEIVMKNGRSYNFYYSKDKMKYYFNDSFLFFGSDKYFDSSEELLQFFIEKCKNYYCH